MKTIYIFLISTFIACNNIPKNSTLIQNFPEIISLQGDSINNFDNELGIMALYDAGDYMICSSHSTDYHFSVYSKDSLKKVANLFKQGRGPGEFIAPAYYSQFASENEDTKIWILERALNKYFKINLSESIRVDSLNVEKQYNLFSGNKTSYRDMYFLNDSVLFGTEDQNDCIHTFLYLSEKKIQSVSPAFKFPTNLNTHEISQNISTKHPTKSCYASAFYNFPQIDFINDQGEIYKTIFYKKIIIPRKITISQREDEYFSTICSDSNYVYALYNPSDNTTCSESSIFVFTWEGEAKCEYKISYATNICVDNKKHKLYAVSSRKENFNVNIYNIPE